eukprot:scaffold14033_cov32-Prasinocladus_malaysianus.AAC.2
MSVPKLFQGVQDVCWWYDELGAHWLAAVRRGGRQARVLLAPEVRLDGSPAVHLSILGHHGIG